MLHLDTNVVIAHFRGDRQVTERLAKALPSVEVSSVVVAELIYGAHSADDPILARKKLDQFLPSVGVVPFDLAGAEVYGRIRLTLRRKGRPIGDVDTLIAAAAISRGAILVTRNRRHFSEVEGLEIEDWLD
jgi:tRNA(fMet)-specific endonuclease VapC